MYHLTINERTFFRVPKGCGAVSRTGSALFVALLLLVSTGCEDADYRPMAAGENDVVTIIVDSTRWQGPVGEALRASIGYYIGTLPAPEPSFGLRAAEMGDNWDLLQTYKNIVIAAVLTDSSAEANFIRARLPEGAAANLGENEGIFVIRDNLWRRGQKVVYLAAANQEALVNTIAEHGSDIRYVFNEMARVRLEDEMFERGRQQNLEEILMENHGFAVNVQHDYLIALDTTNFVWLRRILADSWRSFFIWYQEDANPAVLTPEWIYATRDSLTQLYTQGNLGGFPVIVPPPLRELETENINFIGRYGFETRGLWEMVGLRDTGERFQFGAGGPFINYTFYDEPSGRIYMLDGMVFAPGFDKREFLRQLEVIAHTFRTRQDVQQPEAVAAVN